MLSHGLVSSGLLFGLVVFMIGIKRVYCYIMVVYFYNACCCFLFVFFILSNISFPGLSSFIVSF